MIGNILILEGLGAVAIYIVYLVRISRLINDGKKVIVQKNMEKIGRIMTFIAFAVVAIFTGYYGGRSAVAKSGSLASIYALLGIGALLLFYLGDEFRISGYKTPEDTPKWIKRLAEFLW